MPRFKILIMVAVVTFPDCASFDTVRADFKVVYEHGSTDFPECLSWAQHQRMGCRAMLTFDTKAARVDGVVLASSPS